MKEKMLGAMEKLKNTVVFNSTASMHHNMCLITKVCFRVGAMKVMPKQEETLKKTHEAVMFNNMGLNANFPRKTLHT